VHLKICARQRSKRTAIIDFPAVNMSSWQEIDEWSLASLLRRRSVWYCLSLKITSSTCTLDIKLGSTTWWERFKLCCARACLM
jgi:hypothetical protein